MIDVDDNAKRFFSKFCDNQVVFFWLKGTNSNSYKFISSEYKNISIFCQLFSLNYTYLLHQDIQSISSLLSKVQTPKFQTDSQD